MRQTLIPQVQECFEYMVAGPTFHVLADQCDYSVRSLSKIFPHILDHIDKASAACSIQGKRVDDLLVAKIMPDRLHLDGLRVCVPKTNQCENHLPSQGGACHEKCLSGVGLP